MPIEKLKAVDHISSGLIAGTQSGEQAKATGVYHVECHDKDGNLKWEHTVDQLAVEPISLHSFPVLPTISRL